MSALRDQLQDRNDGNRTRTRTLLRDRRLTKWTKHRRDESGPEKDIFICLCLSGNLANAGGNLPADKGVAPAAKRTPNCMCAGSQ